MFSEQKENFKDKPSLYQRLNAMLKSLTEGEDDLIATFANASALLNFMLDEINWAGFYLLKEEQLVLGPFQGKPACVRIPMGKGVCGTAAKNLKPLVVEDVHQFPGHIACDADSRSEIVVPIIKDGRLIGVLDIDSPIKGRFDYADEEGLVEFTEILCKHIKI